MECLFCISGESVTTQEHIIPESLGNDEGIVEEVDCYSYSLLDFGGRHLLFRFGMGTNHWVICLDWPYPCPGIGAAFPEHNLELVWYSPEEL